MFIFMQQINLLATIGQQAASSCFLFCVYQGEAISTIFCRNQPLCGPFEVLNYKEISELVFASQAQIGKTTGCNILCNTDFEDDILVGLGNFGFFMRTELLVGVLQQRTDR